ncbi:MAG: hypothetical protein JWM11_988 [Planctomycetaceae bacterium]|nr:hypothetical protein [Planctomycetaceae bacterium]
MNLQGWETIIQQIVGELNGEPKASGRNRVLMKWRSKLEKEPPHLQVHQIDEIIREARRRIEAADGS